jgi:6-phospho-beta-glucosidase
VKVDGVDRLPEILDSSLDEIARELELPAGLVRLLEAIPSSYLRYYYLTGEVLEQQRSRPTRAEEVKVIESELLEMYRDPALDRKPELLEQRGGAYYSEAAAQLVASLNAGTGDVQVVDVRNDGAIPNLPDDDVVEVSARVDRDGAHPIAVAPLEPELLALVEHAKAYERLTARAAQTGKRADALRALFTNPLVSDFAVAEQLLDPLLQANRRHLPRFFPAS